MDWETTVIRDGNGLESGLKKGLVIWFLTELGFQTIRAGFDPSLIGGGNPWRLGPKTPSSSTGPH